MMREDWVEIRFDGLISNVSTSNNKVKQREYLQKGLYPVIDQGQELIGGYIDDEEKIVECNLPVIVFGDHTKIVKYINFKFAPGADGTKILEPKRMVEPKYLYYVTKFVAKKIEDRGYARHYQYLRKESVFVAPAPEQRAIVAKIEELFSELDSGIDSLKKAKKQLEVYRQAVLKAAFEGKLTKEWRDKNISTELQNEWMKRKLGDVCDKANKINKKNLDKHEQFIYIDIGSIDNKIYKITSHKVYKWEDAPSRAQQIIKLGDVLFSTVRTYLKNIARVTDSIHDNQICSSGFTVIRGNEKLLDSKFIFYFIIYEGFLQPLNKLQTGTSYPAVRDGDVFEQIIPIPLLKEQHQIVQEIESRLSVCENIESNIEEALEKAEGLRQSILKKAFEGKLLSKEELEVCKQEDDWEPSEKLLKRIKEATKEVK